MEKVVRPIVEIVINGQNVTGEVTPFLSDITYTDKLEEEADDVSLTFEDVAVLWATSWYPQQGDTLNVKIGYDRSELTDCGVFEIDEIESSGPPSTLTVKAISASITKSLRTRNSRAFEEQTLGDIARQIAGAHGLRLTGNTSQLSSIGIQRRTQDNQTDLGFLSRMAGEYGIIFSVKGDQLIFMSPEDLQNQPSAAVIDKSEVSSYKFTDKTSGTFERAEVSMRNMQTNEVVRWQVLNSGDPTKLDTLRKTDVRANNRGQAQALARGILRQTNKDKLTGSISIQGNPRIVAGTMIEVNNFGQFSGRWLVYQTSHSITSNGGYFTNIELRKELNRKTPQPLARNNDNKNVQNWARAVGLA